MKNLPLTNELILKGLRDVCVFPKGRKKEIGLQVLKDMSRLGAEISDKSYSMSELGLSLYFLKIRPLIN